MIVKQNKEQWHEYVTARKTNRPPGGQVLDQLIKSRSSIGMRAQIRFCRRPVLTVAERIMNQDRVLTLRACGKKCHGSLDQLLDPTNIFDRLRRQIDP